MTARSVILPGLLAAAGLLLAGCETMEPGPGAASQPAAAGASTAGPAEDLFVVESDGRELRGVYNPASWTAQDIQRYAGVNCPSGRLVSYGEAPTGDGLVRFGGECG